MLTDFHPHQFSPMIWRTVNLVFPLMLRYNDYVTRIVLSDADREKMRRLRGTPALLLPNHPSTTEPSVLAGLSREVDDPFRYVATHEIFAGWKGALIRRMGTFSIRRGYPDFRSLRMCEDVLLRERAKMVMFPEGETHMQNDTVIPCHRGAIHVAFRALSRVAGSGEPPPMALPIIPLVVRYRYVSDPSQALGEALTRLEAAMGLPVNPPMRLWERARTAGIRVLEGVEREYNLRPPPKMSINERIAAAMDYIAARIITLTNVQAATETVLSLRMRTLYNRVFEYRALLRQGETAYEKHLHERRMVAVAAATADMDRLQNFMIAAEGMVGGASASAERIGETVYRLEREVFGQSRTHPLREAVVRLGEPWDISPFYNDWCKNRRMASHAAVAELENRLRDLLSGVLHISTPATA